MGDHKARNWVEASFPNVKGSLKAMLILAYGSGLDEGLREAQEISKQVEAELIAAYLGEDAPP